MQHVSRPQKNCPWALGSQAFVQSPSHSGSIPIICLFWNLRMSPFQDSLKITPVPFSKPKFVQNTFSGCYRVRTGFQGQNRRGCGLCWENQFPVHVERGQWDLSLSLTIPRANPGRWWAVGPRSAAQAPSEPFLSLLKDWVWSPLFGCCCFAGHFSFPRKDSKRRRECYY